MIDLRNLMQANKFYIEEGHREANQNIGSLADSIRRVGLLQPIIVEETDKGMKIKGGRRRFLALTEYLGIESLKKGYHYIVTDGGTITNALLVQFEENHEREDFSPMELASLVKEIHSQKTKEHGIAHKGVGGGWKQADTAKILGKDHSFVSRLLSIAKNPEEIKGCKTVNEALEKLEQRKAKKIQQTIQKARVEKSSRLIEGLDLQDWIKNLHHADARDFVRSLPSNSINLVYTDPPFGINLDEITTISAYEVYSDNEEEIFYLLQDVIPELYRVLTDEGFIVLWTSSQLFRRIQETMKKAGFGVASNPLFWIKTGHTGKTNNPEKTLGSVAEIAVYGWKGDAVLREQGLQNVFPFPTIRKNRIHVAQKPEPLICRHLEIFSDPGQKVLDIFSGSGAVLRGAYLSKRSFVGCEIDEHNYYSSIDYTYDFFEPQD